MPEFQHIGLFILLAALPLLILLFIFSVRDRKNKSAKIADHRLLNRLLSNSRPYIRQLKFILLCISVVMLVIAAVNPRIPEGNNQIKRNGIDVMLAIDVSKSMLATDVKPSRLERAKQLSMRLIDRMSNDRIGIVVFAGKAYLQMPLTADHIAAKMYIGSANPAAIPTQGTITSSALKMAASAFNSEEKKYKALVLISDGEDHDDQAVQTAKELSKQGIVIYTVGIGSPRGATIPDEETGAPKLDADGKIVVTKLNEDELRSIAAEAKGKYIFFQSADAAAEQILADLASMDKRTITDDSVTNFTSFAVYFLALAFLLVVIEFFISEKKKGTLNIRSAAMIFILAFSTLHGTAQQKEKWVKEGNRYYHNKNYKEASGYYQKASANNPNLYEAYYNNGNANYRMGSFDESLEDYDKAIRLMTDSVQKSNAYYNKGVVLQSTQRLSDCIDAYKKALILNSKNDDARQNLQTALRQQQMQQQIEKNNNAQLKNNKNQPPPPKLKVEDAIEKLKALEQRERDIQDKLIRIDPNQASRPVKDW